MKRKTERKITMSGVVAWFFFVLIACPGYSQNGRMVTGTVINDDGIPLAGATVHLKNTNTNVVTDNEGRFQINALPRDILIFSNVGYENQEIPLGNQSEIHVILHQSAEKMEDVVVTALGITRETRTLTYATQQISGSEITSIKDPGGNVMNSLAGKVANMVVTPAGSGPGGSAKIVLRGNRSINGNNNALLVVDGVPIDNTMSTEASGGGSANTFGTQVKSISSGYSGMDGASSINPEDIESITVLKGPAAAALYGSRAANGALIITTKSGTSGKVSVNYDGGVSVDMPYLLNKFQNTYGRGNGGVYGPTAGQSWGAKPKRTLTT